MAWLSRGGVRSAVSLGPAPYQAGRESALPHSSSLLPIRNRRPPRESFRSAFGGKMGYSVEKDHFHDFKVAHV